MEFLLFVLTNRLVFRSASLASLDNRFRIAVDIGGTFTDIALLTDVGLIHQSKVSTTPADPSLAVIDGVRKLLAW